MTTQCHALFRVHLIQLNATKKYTTEQKSVLGDICFGVGGAWADQLICQSITACFIHLLPLSLESIHTHTPPLHDSGHSPAAHIQHTLLKEEGAMTGHHWGYGEDNGKFTRRYQSKVVLYIQFDHCQAPYGNWCASGLCFGVMSRLCIKIYFISQIL